MSWSWRVGRVAGIDVRLHVTFVLLFAWLSVAPLWVGRGLAAVMEGLLFNAAVFGIVLLHELGHALAAQRYHIQTRHITLSPLGGIASMESMPRRPVQELVVALAGPAVNVGLAVMLGSAWLGGVALLPGANGLPGSTLVEQLFLVNVTMAVFNLIPAFPLDGGRVLRALLAMRFSRVQATWMATRVGQGIAVLLGLAGLFFNPMLMFIAVFIAMAGEQEARATEYRERMSRGFDGYGQPREVTRIRWPEFDVRSEKPAWVAVTWHNGRPVVIRRLSRY